MNATTYNVLFLCVGNSARSIMAEAILNRDGAGRFHAFSAGSQPRSQVEPLVQNLLHKLNYPTEALYPKPWTAFAEPNAPEMDFVFTVCEETMDENCPTWPGQPLTSQWAIPDVSGTREAERAATTADAYRMLCNRIGIFINLPMASLDRMALRQRLEAISAMPKG